ncbi:hypothetical protein SK128_004147, partial [Halocaridina rubra]
KRLQELKISIPSEGVEYRKKSKENPARLREARISIPLKNMKNIKKKNISYQMLASKPSLDFNYEDDHEVASSLGRENGGGLSRGPLGTPTSYYLRQVKKRKMVLK